jgi:hypothetical protein
MKILQMEPENQEKYGNRNNNETERTLIGIEMRHLQMVVMVALLLLLDLNRQSMKQYLP